MQQLVPLKAALLENFWKVVKKDVGNRLGMQLQVRFCFTSKETMFMEETAILCAPKAYFKI